MNDFALSLTHTQNIDNILTPTVQCNDKKSKLFQMDYNTVFVLVVLVGKG